MNIMINLQQSIFNASLAACLAMLLIAPSLQAQDDVEFSGVSLEITDLSGGTSAAALLAVLPVDEDTLILPAFFEGDIETTTLSATFDGSELDILVGLSTALPADAGLFFDDINYILLDVSAHQGESGEVVIEMTTEQEAELFIILSGLEIDHGLIHNDSFETTP